MCGNVETYKWDKTGCRFHDRRSDENMRNPHSVILYFHYRAPKDSPAPANSAAQPPDLIRSESSAVLEIDLEEVVHDEEEEGSLLRLLAVGTNYVTVVDCRV